jgi:hypothetical protein
LIVGKPATEEEIADIRRLAAEGMSANAIARNIGRDPHLVLRYAPYRKRPVYSVTINKIPEVIIKALRNAARRRGMKVETIMFQLVGGTIMRGSIDKTLQRWNAYESERRIGTCDSHNLKERNRAGKGERALPEGVEAVEP